MSEQEVRDYLLYVKDEKRFAEGTLRICYYGIKFFFMYTLSRPWPFLTMLRTPKSNYLPTILSYEEVRSLQEENLFEFNAWKCSVKADTELPLITEADDEMRIDVVMTPLTDGPGAMTSHPVFKLVQHTGN